MTRNAADHAHVLAPHLVPASLFFVAVGDAVVVAVPVVFEVLTKT